MISDNQLQRRCTLKIVIRTIILKILNIKKVIGIVGAAPAVEDGGDARRFWSEESGSSYLYRKAVGKISRGKRRGIEWFPE